MKKDNFEIKIEGLKYGSYSKELNDEFGHIQIKTKNVLDKCRKIRHNSKTAKAINNAAVADEKYKNTLQSLLKEYI